MEKILEKVRGSKDPNIAKFVEELINYELENPGHYKEKYRKLLKKYTDNSRGEKNEDR